MGKPNELHCRIKMGRDTVLGKSVKIIIQWRMKSEKGNAGKKKFDELRSIIRNKFIVKVKRNTVLYMEQDIT